MRSETEATDDALNTLRKRIETLQTLPGAKIEITCKGAIVESTSPGKELWREPWA